MHRDCYSAYGHKRLRRQLDTFRDSQESSNQKSRELLSLLRTIVGSLLEQIRTEDTKRAAIGTTDYQFQYADRL